MRSRKNIKDASVSIDVIVPFLRAVREAGPQINREVAKRANEILTAAGLGVKDFADPELRIPNSLAMKMLDATVKITGDPCFALRAGLSQKPGECGVLECLFGCGETIGQSIYYISMRYLPLIHDGIELNFFEDGDLFHWRHRVARGLDSSTGTNEYNIACFLTILKRQLRNKYSPIEIHFIHDAPDHAREYTRLLGTRVRFNCEYNAIVLPKAAIALPTLYVKSGFYNILERYANELVRRLPVRHPFSKRVSDIVRENLSNGASQIAVAKALNIGERSLRRRLLAEGISHSEIVERVRREVAIELLVRQELNIAEIAYKLGFAHSSAFYRAFKRWYGASPTDYRK